MKILKNKFKKIYKRKKLILKTKKGLDYKFIEENQVTIYIY